jgi:DNA topoisomerase-3
VQLIVAEKPSVARDLARVLGVRPSGPHAFEGDGRVITWCVGHLVELDEPAAYDPAWKAWRLETLPMLPAAFRLRPAGHAGDQLRAVAGLLRDRRFRSVVNACDAGREGELIFRYVYQFAGGGPPVQRLWISSLTDEAIRRGFAALRPGQALDALGDAARARSEADWLVGMNATRAITARGRLAGHTALYSIGRVQTPTLAMLVAREAAIRAFVPRPYWEVRGEFVAEGVRFTAGWRLGSVARLGSAALADAVIARDAAVGAARDPAGPRVERVRARTVREPAPLLFDLTALQRTANKRFGFSAARTLELAQALYERHKILTYPRTDARHLSSDVVGELPALFAALAELADYAPFAAPLVATPPRPGRRIVDDARVHDHHAIIPTATRARLDALDRDERRVFDLVVRRFLAAFYPDAEIAITEAWIRVGAPHAGSPCPPFDPPRANGEARAGDPRAGGGDPRAGAGDPRAGAGDPRARAGDPRASAGDPHASAGAPRAGARANGEPADEPAILERLPPPPDRYLARGRVRVAAGWQAVAGIDDARARGDREDRNEPTAPLPPLVEGQALDGRFASTAKHTTPPPRYTEGTLLGAMESAGKAIDDEALRLAMKDTGLGTPATRAAIIETLLRREYIVRAQQHLAPTPLGAALIEVLPVPTLASPELTGAWEARLARIARGQDSYADFMADIARYVTDLVDAVRAADMPAPPAGSQPEPRWSRAGGPGRAGSRGNRSSGTGRSAGSRTSRARSTVDRARSSGNRADSPGDRTRSSGDRTDSPADRARSSADRTDSPGDRARSAGGRAPSSGDRTGSSDRPSRIRAAASTSAPRSARAGRAASTAAARPAEIGELACPRCGQGTLIAGARGWGCTRWREGCRFVVWFETAGRRLTAAQLRDLVQRGKTRKARFRDPQGAERDGRLVLDPSADNGTVRFEPA